MTANELAWATGITQTAKATFYNPKVANYYVLSAGEHATDYLNQHEEPAQTRGRSGRMNR